MHSGSAAIITPSSYKDKLKIAKIKVMKNKRITATIKKPIKRKHKVVKMMKILVLNDSRGPFQHLL